MWSVIPICQLFASVGVAIEKRRPGAKKLAHARFRGQARGVLADVAPPPEFKLTAEEETLGFEGRMTQYFAAGKGYDSTGPIPNALLGFDQASRPRSSSAGRAPRPASSP